MNTSKILRVYILSAGFLLMLTALAKLLSSFGDARVLNVKDPILGYSFRNVFIMVGLVELAVALYWPCPDFVGYWGAHETWWFNV